MIHTKPKISGGNIFSHNYRALRMALLLLLATIIGLKPAVSDGEAKLDWLAASKDWIGGAPKDPSETWIISFGGRVYDRWYEALNSPQLPDKEHPAYPAKGKFGGVSTWRCKECHGWDYKGKDGAYSEGLHFTGAPGIRHLAGADPEKIPEILTNKTHGFTKEMIPDVAMRALALFLTKGQHDADRYIDRKTGKVNGDPARGKLYYQNICAACHGFDGKTINFAEGEDDEEGPIEYVGTIANDNPWETLHKILNGQPGQPMPALRVLPMKDVINILAYAQTLPAE